MDGMVVVVAAHAYEARAVAGVARDVSREPWGRWTLYRGEMWDMNVAIVRCGPGKTAAAAATQAAVQYLDPAVIVSFGTAGCCDPAIRRGSVVVVRSVVDVALAEADGLPVRIPDRFDADGDLLRQLLAVPGTQEGRVLSWEGHVASPAHRPAAARSSGTDATLSEVVDWESAAVAQVSSCWGIPWGGIKVVSDHGEPGRLRLLAVAARRPLQWAAEVLRRASDAYLKERFDTRDPGATAVNPGREENGE